MRAAGRSASDLRVSLPVAAGVLTVDQLSKQWAVNALDDRNIDLFWTLRFNLTYNSGMAFGRGGGFGPVIGVVALAVVVAVLVSMRRTGSTFAAIAVGAVVGGALGNIADRAFRSGDGFMRGAVVDFIDVQWWPIWNVADMGVTLGGIALVLASLRQPQGTAVSTGPESPSGAMSGGPVPGESVSGGSVPGGAVSGGTVSGESVSGESVSGESVSGESTSGESVSGDSPSGDHERVGTGVDDDSSVSPGAGES